MEQNISTKDTNGHEKKNTNLEVKEMGLFERITGVFFSSTNAFENLNRKPDWVVPFIIVLVASTFFSTIVAPIGMKENRDKQVKEMVEKRGMSVEQAEQAYDVGMKYGKIFAPIGGAIFTVLSLVVVSGVLLFVGNFIFGGEGKFITIFSIYVYTSLIWLVEMLIKGPLMIMNETTNVQTSLALLLDEAQKDSLLFKSLARFDIFSFWQIALVSIGIGIVYKFSMNKSIGIVGTLWVLYSIGVVLIGVAFGSSF
jgi:hypothetical protein